MQRPHITRSYIFRNISNFLQFLISTFLFWRFSRHTLGRIEQFEDRWTGHHRPRRYRVISNLQLPNAVAGGNCSGGIDAAVHIDKSTK